MASSGVLGGVVAVLVFALTIAYVTLFFAATGGMLGIAADAGKGWMYGSIALFLVMAVLAFVQRRMTGM